MKFILVCSNDNDTKKTIANCLSSNYKIKFTGTNENCVLEFAKERYDFLFIDIDRFEPHLEKGYKKELQKYWQIFPDSEIIVITKHDKIRNAVDAVKAGASDYLSLPLVEDDLRYVVNRIEEHTKLKSELSYLRGVALSSDLPVLLRTNSSAMKELYSNIRSVAQTDSTVLITGETGTGKGVIAKLIHQQSKRNTNQFISVHCGAIPETLLESDLFGHEKGAFTGAVRRKLGKFEIAETGTIFLDEIGTISLTMQIKLLQILQDKIFYRVGGELPIKTDVRLITATNSDLNKMMEEGDFRSDLYYRLNVFQIEVPPLRERKVDLPLLVDSILKRLNKFNTKEIADISGEVMNAFYEYDFPGNIRELENLIERAYILETTQILTPKSFPIRLFKNRFQKFVQPVDISKTLDEVRRIELERIEADYLSELLTKNLGKITTTAADAGVTPRQVNKLMHKYNLKKEAYKLLSSQRKSGTSDSE